MIGTHIFLLATQTLLSESVVDGNIRKISNYVRSLISNIFVIL